MEEFGEGNFWITKEEGFSSMGITQKALDLIGTVESIEFSEEGDEFNEGDWVAEIYGNNTSLEVLAPRKLKVKEVNRELGEQPELLEDDPTGDAWILRVETIE